MRRVTPLYFAARVAAEADPDAARVMALHENGRGDGHRATLELLRTKAVLRPGLSQERATDLLLMFVGMDAYHALVDGRGWTHDEWIDWTVSAVEEQIFAGAASERVTRRPRTPPTLRRWSGLRRRWTRTRSNVA